MASPSELSLEEIRKYLINNNGSARNHDLVKYFKTFLTDPLTRGEFIFNDSIYFKCCLSVLFFIYRVCVVFVCHPA